MSFRLPFSRRCLVLVARLENLEEQIEGEILRMKAEPKQ